MESPVKNKSIYLLYKRDRAARFNNMGRENMLARGKR